MTDIEIKDELVTGVTDLTTAQAMVDRIDNIFGLALADLPETLHSDIHGMLVVKGIITGAGVQNYAESICGKKKQSPPN